MFDPDNLIEPSGEVFVHLFNSFVEACCNFSGTDDSVLSLIGLLSDLPAYAVSLGFDHLCVMKEAVGHVSRLHRVRLVG